MLVRAETFRFAQDGVDPVALGATATHTQTTAPVTWDSFNHTLVADDDLVLALVTYQGNAGLTGITYGGVAMTELAQVTGENRRSSVFYLLNASLPAAGTKAVVVDPDSGAAGHATVVALQGAEQAAPAFDDGLVDGGTSTTASVTVAAGGIVLKVACMDGLHQADVTEGVGETVIFEDEQTVGAVNLTHQSSYKLNQSGLTAMSTSWTGNEDASQLTIGVDPV